MLKYIIDFILTIILALSLLAAAIIVSCNRIPKSLRKKETKKKKGL